MSVPELTSNPEKKSVRPKRFGSPETSSALTRDGGVMADQ
jgi:hypothetical protein